MVAQIAIGAVDALECLGERARISIAGCVIHQRRVEEARRDDLPFTRAAQPAIITRAVAIMAGSIAALIDLQQQAVALAVDMQRHHLLHMAGGFAFLPETPARAAPEMRQA